MEQGQVCFIFLSLGRRREEEGDWARGRFLPLFSFLGYSDTEGFGHRNSRRVDENLQKICKNGYRLQRIGYSEGTEKGS
jgi:hypothetical protein